MAFAIALWFERLLSSATGADPLPQSVDRKPMEIEIQRLPDYLWRDLGFRQPSRPDGE